MYGTYWCRYCDMQRQLFGKEAWSKVPYVECDGRCVGSQPAKCEAAGVEGFPEWILPDGRHISGLLDLDRLEAVAAATKSAVSPSPQPAKGIAVQLAMPRCDDCKVGERVPLSQ